MTRGGRAAQAVAAVVAAALDERGAAVLALLDDGSPEAALLAAWLQPGLGAARMVRISRKDPGLEPLLHAVAGFGADPAAALWEALRSRARLVPGSVVAHPGNKTALLLGGALPPERLLPLGDVWASQVLDLCGGWSAPAPVLALAERAGGVARLDGALRAWLEGRDPDALARLPREVSGEVRERFAAGAADRVQSFVVPKLSPRTLGMDLFE